MNMYDFTLGHAPWQLSLRQPAASQLDALGSKSHETTGQENAMRKLFGVHEACVEFMSTDTTQTSDAAEAAAGWKLGLKATTAAVKAKNTHKSTFLREQPEQTWPL